MTSLPTSTPPRLHARAGLRLLLPVLLCGGWTAFAATEVEDAAAQVDDPATATASQSAAANAPVADADAYTAFRHHFDAGNYADAIDPAQQVLRQAEQAAKSPAAEEVQVALMNLATTQYLAGEYVGAEESYSRAIRLVQDSGRPRFARLARAHGGLADTYQAGRRHDLAVPQYEQAIALTRRHEGLLTEGQVPLLEKSVESLTELGRYAEALQLQRYVLRIATRRHGETGAGVAPTLERIGRWYVQVGAYEPARRMLRRAIALVEAAAGERSPQLVGPLTALATCNRRQLLDPSQQAAVAADAERASLFHDATAPMPHSAATLLAEGERALVRAAEIADGSGGTTPALVANVRTQLGDWYQARAQHDRALPHYRLAWQAAVRANERQVGGKPLADALFGRPVMVHVVRPDGWDRYAQRPRDQVEVRTVALEFSVTTEGRPQDWKVVDDSGDPKRAEKTLDALRTARYRPRFQDGDPVATDAVGWSQPWIVLVEEDTRTPARAEDGA